MLDRRTIAVLSTAFLFALVLTLVYDAKSLAGAFRQNALGRMPPGFDQGVARVEAEVNQIEQDALRQMRETTLDRHGATLQFYFESTPDERGYSPNSAGASYVDKGVGLFLRKLKSLSGQLNPNSTWV